MSIVHGWVKLPKSASYTAVSSSRESRTSERAHRTSEGAQFPIEDTNNPILSRMEDEVIQLVVPVNNPQAQLLLIRQIGAVPGYKFAKEGYIPCLLVGLDVRDFSLGA